jgi:primosomal protein N' (replication factor Y)
MSILRVALDLPLPRLFDYSCAEASEADIGMRVLLPLGNKQVVGVIIALADTSEISADKLKPAVRILRETQALGRDWLELVQFCSDYYHRPLGEVIFNGLPVRLRKPGAPLAFKQAAAYRLSASGREALAQWPAKLKRALLQNPGAVRLCRGVSAGAEPERETLAEPGSADGSSAIRRRRGRPFRRKVRSMPSSSRSWRKSSARVPVTACFCCTASPAAARPRSTCV